MKYLLTAAGFLLLASCKKDKKTEQATVPAPVTSIGATYAGGIVFYLSSDGQHGMVINSVNIDTCIWSLNNDPISTSPDFGSGQANTDAICNSQGAGTYAAKVCQDLVLNGYSDWYLPSKEEFLKVLQTQVLGAYTSLNPNEGYYWTSTGSSQPIFATYAELTNSVTPPTDQIERTYLFRVRAVRSF